MPGPKTRIGVDTKVRPADRATAALAYLLWVDKGCSAGSDQEDWYQAEAILERLLISNVEDLQNSTSTDQCCETGPDVEVVIEFPWDGHWEIWEREWGGAHWVWDNPQH
jgi:hypothetical protein